MQAARATPISRCLPQLSFPPSLPPWILRNARVRQKACCKLAFLRLSLERIPTRLPAEKENCTKVWLEPCSVLGDRLEVCKKRILLDQRQAEPGTSEQKDNPRNHRGDLTSSRILMKQIAIYQLNLTKLQSH